ncbi:hypothetical protein SAMD00023353_0603110 [Rosellinia necatrix]|uniref:Uncharacterized protein n=1 Tax=Rosellinia necatrix TaxID=77044 RepID=A0A1S7UKV6_ROSNE|nr:hypothetical protein SAMD00023353_0603110 [Rosellinia necatrix]
MAPTSPHASSWAGSQSTPKSNKWMNGETPRSSQGTGGNAIPQAHILNSKPIKMPASSPTSKRPQLPQASQTSRMFKTPKVPKRSSVDTNNRLHETNKVNMANGETPILKGFDHDHTIEIVATTSCSIEGQRQASRAATRFLDIQHGEDVKGVYTLVKNAESLDPEAEELKRKRKAIDDLLEDVQKRRRVFETKVNEVTRELRAERVAASISDELWREYEAFCSSPFLQPDPGEKPKMLSFTYNKDFNDSYIKYDPHFGTFKGQGLFGMGENWRCHRTTTYSKGGTPFLYHAEFRKLCPEYFGGVKTWSERFPALYKLALDATKQGSTAALEMLATLPYADDRRPSGHIFEFAYEETCGLAPAQVSRWTFRTSYSLRTHHGVLWHHTSEKKQAEFIHKYELPFKVIKSSGDIETGSEEGGLRG